MSGTVTIKTDATLNGNSSCPVSVSIINASVWGCPTCDPFCTCETPDTHFYMYCSESGDTCISGGQRTFTIPNTMLDSCGNTLNMFPTNQILIRVIFYPEATGGIEWVSQGYLTNGGSITFTHYFGTTGCTSPVGDCNDEYCGSNNKVMRCVCAGQPSGDWVELNIDCGITCTAHGVEWDVGDYYCETDCLRRTCLSTGLWSTGSTCTGDYCGGAVTCTAHGGEFPVGGSYCESDCLKRTCQSSGQWATGTACTGGYCTTNGGNEEGINWALVLLVLGVGAGAAYIVSKKM